MAYLVDTNILVRLAAPADPRHQSARRAIEELAEEDLYAASQNFIELWNVTTRPVQNNGLGQTITAADQILKTFELTFSRLPEPAVADDRWGDLAGRLNCSVKYYEARIGVALLLQKRGNRDRVRN